MALSDRVGLEVRMGRVRLRGMACAHPPEERQRVYEGTTEPRLDRSFCGLCGLVVYEAVEEQRPTRLALPERGQAFQRT